MNSRILAILAALAAPNPAPAHEATREAMDAWVKRCNEVSLIDLGHLIYTATDEWRREIAVRIGWERLGNQP